MKKRGWIAKAVLLPISKIYGMVTCVRNWMFDMRLLKEKEFDVPVVSVGNISVGGTGKTPHVEYIVERLRHNHHVAILSRGYKRDTSGFVLATHRSTPADIGDEPYQMYHRFGEEVVVAVCEDRVAGINELLKIDKDIDLVILDDAFQHRYVKPAVSVVLTEYACPLFQDSLLPYGTLRESHKGLKRADIVIATKCPDKVSAIDMRIFEENLGLMAYQRMFFSKLAYCRLEPVFPAQAGPVAPALEWLGPSDMILVVAGIGNPKPFVKYIRRFRPKVRVNIYPDHHAYTRKDINVMAQRFDTMDAQRKFIVTTEKDAVRLANNPYFPHQLKPYIYYLPIRVEFMRDERDALIDEITKRIKLKALGAKIQNP